LVAGGFTPQKLLIRFFSQAAVDGDALSAQNDLAAKQVNKVEE
jgi:hypothetical protein